MENTNRKISFEAMPSLIESLIKEISEMKALVINTTASHKNEKRIPIGIDQACQIISKAKPTVYTLVRKGLLPHFKQGIQLYFFEDELIKWIEDGKRKTHENITTEVQKAIHTNNKNTNRPHRF